MASPAIAVHFERPGIPTDQAWIETFFGHLKTGFPHLLKITEPAVLRAELDHLQVQWNTVRLPPWWDACPWTTSTAYQRANRSMSR